MTEEYLFTCKKCGSHDLRVMYEYKVITVYTKILPCKCGQSEESIAGVQTHIVEIDYKDDGYLDDDHHVEWEETREEIDREETTEDEVFCHQCLKENKDLDLKWKTSNESSEVDENSTEYLVYCDGCEREIEFGYSHHNRGGRIWPAECTDFNPWKTWPDSRYLESWRKKNWLRPKKKRNK